MPRCSTLISHTGKVFTFLFLTTRWIWQRFGRCNIHLLMSTRKRQANWRLSTLMSSTVFPTILSAAISAELLAESIMHALFCFCLVVCTAYSTDIYQDTLSVSLPWKLLAVAIGKLAKVVVFLSMEWREFERLKLYVLFPFAMFPQNFCSSIGWCEECKLKSTWAVQGLLCREHVSYGKVLTNSWRPFIRLYCLCFFWSVGCLRRSGLFTVLYLQPVRSVLWTGELYRND